MKALKWFLKRFHISFAEFALVFTVSVFVAGIMYLTYLAGLKLAEMHYEGFLV